MRALWLLALLPLACGPAAPTSATEPPVEVPDAGPPAEEASTELVGLEPPADDTFAAPGERIAAIQYARTPRWKIAWRDEFEGPKSRSEDTFCFSGRPLKCAYGTNAFVEDCKPADAHPGLAHLNRCTWTVLVDYNYWSNHTATFAADMVRVENGELILDARTDRAGPYDCGTALPSADWLFTSKCPYAVGGVISQKYVDIWSGDNSVDQVGYQKKFGRFEVRGRVSTGPGSFPAYWMWPQGGNWSTDGEIDIMEYVHAYPDRAVQTAHSGTGSVHAAHGTWLVPGAAWASTIRDDYHTFSVEWDPGMLRFSIDNRIVSELPNGAPIDDVWDSDTCSLRTPAQNPMYFLLNDGITTFTGGDAAANAVWSAFKHREGHIDYVRTYDRCDEGDLDPACVESTLSSACPNPCAGVGKFDGYNCWLRSAPSGMKLYEENGHFMYRTKIIATTLASQCRAGDPYVGLFKGCDAGLIPQGRRSFEYGQGFYLASVCSTTARPPICANPCPWGGSYDTANCYLAAVPGGSAPFVWERNFYYKAVNGTCPHQPPPYTAAYDGANCHVKIAVPEAASPFVHNNRYYFKACGWTPDFQNVAPASMGTTKSEPSCAPM